MYDKYEKNVLHFIPCPVFYSKQKQWCTTSSSNTNCNQNNAFSDCCGLGTTGGRWRGTNNSISTSLSQVVYNDIVYAEKQCINKLLVKVKFAGIFLHFIVFREFGDWDRMDISPNKTAHTFEELRCGTNYQFYLQVSNVICKNTLQFCHIGAVSAALKF